MSLRRTIATVGHLRPSQVVYRVLQPFRAWYAGRATHRFDCRLLGAGPSLPLPLEAERMMGERFRSLAVERDVAGPDRWRPDGVSRLWAYRLHCFRWIHGVPAGEGSTWIHDWIERNPSGSRPGWEPYCLSLRVREWLEFLAGTRTPEKNRETRASLVQQVDALMCQIEYHLEGNHLLENAITLCWAGLRLSTPRRHAWLRLGLMLLGRTLREQVLADGAHAERSPMYQALLAEALLRLARVAAASRGAAAEGIGHLAGQAGYSLLRTLTSLVHPDGDYALVNDTALGAAPTLAALHACHAPLREGGLRMGVDALPSAGFLTWRGKGGSYLLFDAGPVGPSHQPGHGHAGALAFELSHRGRRLITDSGVFTYDRGAMRGVDRSTAAHSTVEIDGQDQSDLWAAFRCGRRIRPQTPQLRELRDGAVFRGGYVGPGPGLRSVRHARCVRVTEYELCIRDHVRCAGRHRAVSRLHLAPGVDAVVVGEGVEFRCGKKPVARLVGGGPWEVGRSVHHPTFGVEEERVCLASSARFQGCHAAAWKVVLL